ncbi:MAG: Crp/Fnr family transcriptional regulator [Hyphomicrobiales bacterium]
METVSSIDRTTPWTAGSSIFEELDPENLTLIASLATRSRFAAGEILFFQEDPGDALYMVEEGSVEISVMAANGRKLSLNVMRPGEVFGEIAVLDGGPRTATATIMEPSSLLRVTRKDLLGLMRSNPKVASNLLSMLCMRLRWTSQLAEDLGLLGIQERLARRLMILDRKFSDSHGELHLCQNELADFLGATRESTNKVLRHWREDGLVDLSRGSVRILDAGRLFSIASNAD